MATKQIRHNLDLVRRFRQVALERSARVGRVVTIAEVTDPILAAALPKLEAQEGIEEA